MEIADHLSLSIKTVRSHLKNIYTKMHVRQRAEVTGGIMSNAISIILRKNRAMLLPSHAHSLVAKCGRRNQSNGPTSFFHSDCIAAPQRHKSSGHGLPSPRSCPLPS